MTIVVGLERGWCGKAGAGFDLAAEASVVELVDVGERGELRVVEAVPCALRVDEFPLAEPVEALGRRVVVAVALAADRGDDLVVGEPSGVTHAETLTRLNRSWQHCLAGGSVGAR